MKLTFYKKRHKQTLPAPGSLDEPFTGCPFCQSSSISELGVIDILSNIKVLQCNDCEIGFISRQPTQLYLKDFYRNYYDERTKCTTISPARLARHIYSISAPVRSGNPFTLLDFGGGDASISVHLARLLIENKLSPEVLIYLVDFFPSAVSDDERIRIRSFTSLPEIPAGTGFDIIIASAVLEHIKDPKKVFSFLLKSLNHRGMMYARTPHMYPIYRTLWKIGVKTDYPYPAHLFDMGSKFWRNAIKLLNHSNEFRFVHSTTSIVETNFNEQFLRTLIAYCMKAPSNIFPSYPFSGGWEVLIERNMTGRQSRW